MEVDLPFPNPGLAAVLRSERMKAIVLERAELAQALYEAQVAKRTGTLAGTAHALTEIGGVEHDRWVGVVTVGEGIFYGASHEFGHVQRSRRSETTGRFTKGKLPKGQQHFVAGAHDLNAVLEELGTL